MKLKSTVATFAAASIFALSIGSGALAQSDTSTVSQEITGGEFTYSLSDGTMEAITFDYSQTTDSVTSGAVTLQVDDARGTREGWTVSIASGEFVYAGEASGDNNISGANLAVSPESPSLVAGESIEGVTAGTSGSLGSSRTVINAASGSGSGQFTQNLPLALTVPALSPTGTYTATLTVSTTAAPGTGN